MRKRLTFVASALLALLVLSAPANASFGMKEVDVTFNNEDGSTATQAGSHPYSMTTTLAFNTVPDPEGLVGELPDENIKDLTIFQVPGLVGKPDAMPTCTNAQFLKSECPAASQVGMTDVTVGEPTSTFAFEVFSLTPPPGVPVKIAFSVLGVPITIELGVSEEPPYEVVAKLPNIPNPQPYFRSELTLWGVPANASHDKDRDGSVNIPEEAFLTAPRACEGPLTTTFIANSWQTQGVFDTKVSETHDEGDPPAPHGFSGCAKLGFSPSIASQPTSKAATSPTGLDFSLDVKDEGLTNPAEEAIANSDIEKTEVTLPEGFTINPSIAEGLEVCTEDQLDRETAFSEAGQGCPSASKIGSVEVESALLDENVNGALYQAAPYENPFHSLVALYIVIKNPTLGIKVIQPLKVVPNPVTGQLTTIAEDMPQLPFSHFRLHFREGARSPLSTPSACGTYQVKAKIYPYSGAAPLETSAPFQIISGPEGGPCPKGGLPPLHPELLAGTINNAAGSFSPFNTKITRTDSEQEITHFSIKLPPGVAGKLAGIPFCSDAQIARAKARTGPQGGHEELSDPSCPAASQVGRSLAGSGVGPSLAYAPGKVYLAGPYHGSPVSLVAITAGVVGPFDIGTVVVRLAIRVNPETGEVFLDSVGSDAIPHIIKGIPIHLRDIRAYTDRPEFTFNPTSCARKSTAATVLGAGLDFASEADDNPFVSSSPFQAADCAALPFKPRLSFRLSGGTKRGAHPALKAFLRMNGFGEAGVARARVTLPRSEFIENAHFDTICTRAQFKLAGGNGEACPAGSVYGWARAKSPILDEVVEGPVFLRSSEHQLPDIVASLRGKEINVHLVGHVDSVKGQLRNTFETVPDAPVEWASFSFKGAKKGLFVNSTDLCKGTHKAKVELTGQNGKSANYGAPLKAKCKGKAKKSKRAGR